MEVWAGMEPRHTALRTVTRTHIHVQMVDGWNDYRASIFGIAYTIHIYTMIDSSA